MTVDGRYRYISPHGPLARAYAAALRWAHAAEDRRYTDFGRRPEQVALRERLWARVRRLRRYVAVYVPHPDDPWPDRRIRGRANRFRRRYFALSAAARRADMEQRGSRAWNSYAWQYITWGPPKPPESLTNWATLVNEVTPEVQASDTNNPL